MRPVLCEDLADPEVGLVVLMAPSGYGKTTLLAQYARQPRRTAAWVTLHADDGEDVALEQAVVQAVTTALPGLALLLWRASLDSPASVMARAQALARDLDGVEGNVDLILDGTDVLGANAGRWLEAFLAMLGEGHRLLLSGCERPPLALTQLLAAGSARVIGPEALAFSLDETRVYFAERQVPEDPDGAWRALEGWPAGLALVASGAAPLLMPHDLVRDVLERLPPEIRSGLPEAAVADTWTEAGLARLGARLPAGWLPAARRVGLPLTPLQSGAARPHRLLLELLEEELRAQPTRHAELHMAAGRAAEADGEALRALGHYLKAGALATALDLVGQLVRRYELRWEAKLVRQVVEGLPEAHLTPHLRRAWGRALLETGEAARGEAVLRALRAEGYRDRKLMFALGTLAAREGRFQDQLALAEEGLSLVQADEPTLSLIRLRAAALLGCGRVQEALTGAQAAAAQAEAEDNLIELGAILSLLHSAYKVLGRPMDSERALRRGLEVYEALGMPSRALHVQNNLACLLQAQGRLDEGVQVAAQALALADQEGGVMRPVLQATLADLYRASGCFAEAAGLYRAALEGSAAFKLDTLPPLIWPGLAEAALRCGDHPAAAEALNWARHLSGQGAHEPTQQLAFCEGLFAFEDGDLDRAGQHFRVTAVTQAASELQVRAQAYLAEIARRQGQLTDVHLAPLRPVLAQPGWGALRADTAVLEGLFGDLQVSGGAVPTRQSPSFQHQLSSVMKAPVTLSLSTLGTLKVDVQGAPLHLPRAKSGEILVWLAQHGPGTRDQLVNALWDGSAERRHGEHFRVAVRQLRCALATHPAVTFNPLPFEAGVYRLSEQFELQLDWRLARPALRSGRAEALERVLNAYAGPFLPHLETEWIREQRAQAAEDTLAAALALGALLQDTEPHRALWAYGRAADLDLLNEQAQRGVIRAHLKLGEVAAAERAYAQYARVLRDELGDAPPFFLSQA
ncbi:BTAD domain-containing putative transcriptional regulator [Deinococcus aquaedulcis]|uniref:BTAD domain-containing putative transcriptional regulator n=1 Tax=Deinococcus aquaedulcis TaxID=2840455 RepID=UPI001C82CDAA|nr:BTAD domain-containing putative transcriptional regulator [Deinococcus aquaedulcis]